MKASDRHREGKQQKGRRGKEKQMEKEDLFDALLRFSFYAKITFKISNNIYPFLIEVNIKEK